MKTIIINKIEIKKKQYLIEFQVKPEDELVSNGILIVDYPKNAKKNIFFPFMIAMSLILPLVAVNSKKIIVKSDYVPDKMTTSYWKNILYRLKLNVEELNFEAIKSSGKIIKSPRSKNNRGRYGLMFGGGVESNFALSVLNSPDLDLISIVGDWWMNNNTNSENYNLKRNLEEKMIKEEKLNFFRINTNARCFLEHDEIFNRYVSGLLFYFLALPLCQQRKVNVLYKSSELEDAIFSDHDLCLHPTIVPYLAFPEQMLFLPIFNAFPKILILNELSHTPFLKYIYSCLNNDSKRWCGNCWKCKMISAFFGRLGLNKKIIDMPDNILEEREKNFPKYWQYMDQLFPEPVKKSSVTS